jgi:tryptophan synthase alpha chain
LNQSTPSLQPGRRSIAEVFAPLRARGEIALMPFIPAGYPDLATTEACLPALEAAGASLVEVGFPFSDPIADGPVVQEAFTLALSKKLKMADVFGSVKRVRPRVSIPLVSMVSYSIVYRFGVDRFVATAKGAGFDGLILPDLPPPEAEGICERVWAGGLDTILLVAPTTTPQRRAEIAKLSSGFVYYLSVSGITGERDELPSDVVENVRQLKGLTDRPVCVGFGISKPGHVAGLRGVADGAIVGSSVVKAMRLRMHEGSDAVAREVGRLTRELLGDGAR